MQIIVKNYAHYNRAMGKFIKSKDHYDYEMKANNYVDFDVAKAQAEKYNKANRKDYVLSNKAKAIIEAAKNSADSKGNVSLGDRTIKAMKEIGAIKSKKSDIVPKSYNAKGGFL